MPALRGSLWALLLYDISEEIDLKKVRALLPPSVVERDAARRGPSPEYAGLTRPPATLPLPVVQIDTGDTWGCAIKFYDYGVVSVALELPFDCEWEELVSLCSRWIGSPALEEKTVDIARAHAHTIRAALGKPHQQWTSEDYYVVHVRDEGGSRDDRPLAADFLERHGSDIAQIVRGENTRLSDNEESEILRSYLSYYPTDLLVVGWMAAFVYDTAAGGAAALQLLEYANTQLIEFRYYDEVLSGVLDWAYRSFEHRGRVWGRWRAARRAEELNRLRLEVIELTERVDTSIKFLGDMFYARAYRLAARKVGVTDYRDLVDEKLKTAADLYQSMVNEYHQARAFVLELMVVAILVIELGFLFTGKR